jgi:hypothetical protein
MLFGFDWIAFGIVWMRLDCFWIMVFVLSFEFRRFEFVSDFELRYSSFKSVTLYKKKTYMKIYAFALTTCGDHWRTLNDHWRISGDH